jgi:predicted polyphosphate/ATP-dependent NAD kinase
MAGDKIVGSSIDDYQFMAKDTSIGVPNSDKDFGTYFKDATRVLGSKRTNTVSYSANMANSGATIAIDKNFDAIQAFVAGKTVAELEAIIKTNGTDPKVDAVASATLTDTNGYLNAIAAAAKNAKKFYQLIKSLYAITALHTRSFLLLLL